ncbi:MAG: hypothetical protein FWG68_04575, partial [Defluviitaleaceae bacterium]|nr:hypothetical protein [Defluviitaleaceae bacterium]
AEDGRPYNDATRRGDRPRSPVVKPPTPTPPFGWGQTVARLSPTITPVCPFHFVPINCLP